MNKSRSLFGHFTSFEWYLIQGLGNEMNWLVAYVGHRMDFSASQKYSLNFFR